MLAPPSYLYKYYGKEYSGFCGAVPSGVISTSSQCALKYLRYSSNKHDAENRYKSSANFVSDQVNRGKSVITTESFHRNDEPTKKT